MSWFTRPCLQDLWRWKNSPLIIYGNEETAARERICIEFSFYIWKILIKFICIIQQLITYIYSKEMLWKHNFRRYNFFTMSFHSFFLLEQKESVQMHLNKIDFNERKRKDVCDRIWKKREGLPGVRWAFDWLLAILSPSPRIRRRWSIFALQPWAF